MERFEQLFCAEQSYFRILEISKAGAKNHFSAKCHKSRLFQYIPVKKENTSSSDSLSLQH